MSDNRTESLLTGENQHEKQGNQGTGNHRHQCRCGMIGNCQRNYAAETANNDNAVKGRTSDFRRAVQSVWINQYRKVSEAPDFCIITSPLGRPISGKGWVGKERLHQLWMFAAIRRTPKNE